MQELVDADHQQYLAPSLAGCRGDADTHSDTNLPSGMHGSEEALATFACDPVRTLERPCVLVGGLGMGFTLRATVDCLPLDATVVVAELLPAVVEWNRGPLGPLAGHPLSDKRVRIETGDVAATLRSGSGRFDAVLLDVDNGPSASAESFGTISQESRQNYADYALPVGFGGRLEKAVNCGRWPVWNAFLSREHYRVAQVGLPHRPGELANAASRLGEARINIKSVYAGIDPNTNSPLVFFGALDAAGAARIS